MAIGVSTLVHKDYRHEIYSKEFKEKLASLGSGNISSNEQLRINIGISIIFLALIPILNTLTITSAIIIKWRTK